MRNAIRLLLALAAAAPLAAAAQQVTVTASVAPTCTFASPSTLAFDPYDVNAATPVGNSTSFTVTCTKDTTYQIGLGAGSYSDASSRRMRHASITTEHLGYRLCTDAACTTLWGSGGTFGATVPHAPTTRAPATFTVHGLIPVNQDVAAGNYFDTVQITITP
jgi:spore coat protein U-like protein